MCGIIGIAGHSPVNQQIFDGLTVLQHRGQDAAGIATCDNGKVVLRKCNGLVREAIRTRHMQKLKGSIGIGHVRYPTAGTASQSEAQPFYVNSPFGIVLAHNGTLNNSTKLKMELFFQDQRHINTQSDSEILLNVFAQELLKRRKVSIAPNDVFDAVCNVYNRCKGAYAVVAMMVNHGIIAFRDPFGIRPLIFGTREGTEGKEYCVASESVALQSLGYEIERDVKPGEAIYITRDGDLHAHQCYPEEDAIHSPCLFEYVYFARPDSVIDEVFVHKARMRLGKRLARKIKRIWPDYKKMIDIVVPIPSTSRGIALEMSRHLKIPYREGFIKNRYIGRTFIMPEQTAREKSVKQKLNVLNIEFKNKNTLLVDDSIVRGTTSKEIIQMVREAGARNVYLASASPVIRYPNVYGIDMPAASELVGHGRTEEQIKDEIGADGLVYQDLDDLKHAVTKGNPKLTHFEDSVFTGEYITGLPEGYLENLAKVRSDATKIKNIEELEEEDYVIY
jgi:amidophosphoribosyltransferase